MASASPGLGRTALKVLPVLARQGRKSRRWFAYGNLAAIGVVVSRLALPWPLRKIAKWKVGAGTTHIVGGVQLGGTDYILAMGVMFLVIILSLGLFDFLSRLFYARFAIGMVRDLRSNVLESALRLSIDERQALISRINFQVAKDDRLDNEVSSGDSSQSESASGDFVSRLVSDTARLKSGVQSFLVHVVTNSLLLAGIVVVLCMIDLTLGLVFAAAAAGTALVTAWAAQRIFYASNKARAKEGKLVERIKAAVKNVDDEYALARLNASSGGASQTRLQGISTWSAHMFFGLAVLGSLWIGARSLEAGRMEVADLVVPMMYALHVRASFVRLARQGAKSGRMMAAALRLVQLIENPASARNQIDMDVSRKRSMPNDQIREVVGI